jgi:hypothetical protein
VPYNGLPNQDGDLLSDRLREGYLINQQFEFEIEFDDSSNGGVKTFRSVVREWQTGSKCGAAEERLMVESSARCAMQLRGPGEYGCPLVAGDASSESIHIAQAPLNRQQLQLKFDNTVQKVGDHPYAVSGA